MKISDHISFKEATKSATALKHGIDNKPSASQLEIMKHLAWCIFEPIRNWFDTPIFISSFYRSKELNRRIGGATSSDHMVLGDTAAIDLDQDAYPSSTASNNDIFHWVRKNVEYYKLIAEFPDENGKISWVHISYSTDDSKNMEMRTLIAVKKSGKTHYLNYENHKHLVK